MQVTVVGGGIIGLAVAQLLARTHPAASVTVLEKEQALACHQSAANSGVVHAGLYYEPGSLKARLCRRGTSLLRAYCAERGVVYEECGKLVIATREDELARLQRLEQRAIANGVEGLRRLDAAGLRAIEPHAGGIAALHSPQTAITDFRQVALSLAADLVGMGGAVRTGTAAVRVQGGPARSVIELADGSRLGADHAIVCAGLHADRLARASGQPAEPRIMPFRGEYWQLREERRPLVNGLIYPVPDPRLPFLGVHLTRRVDGSVLLGPNAILALAREGYRRGQIEAAEVCDILAWGGTWRLLRRHWRAGAVEALRSLSKAAFVAEARHYVPELRAGDAIAAPAGVRAQAVNRDGTLVDDFRFGCEPRVTWVRNAPSPGATSALAIAEEILERARLG